MVLQLIERFFEKKNPFFLCKFSFSRNVACTLFLKINFSVNSADFLRDTREALRYKLQVHKILGLQTGIAIIINGTNNKWNRIQTRIGNVRTYLSNGKLRLAIFFLNTNSRLGQGTGCGPTPVTEVPPGRSNFQYLIFSFRPFFLNATSRFWILIILSTIVSNLHLVAGS